MPTFSDVSIDKKANIYFDGKVTSRTLTFADGGVKTLGIMLPGEYEFSTDKAELMEITAGKAKVKLAGTSQWIEYKGDESFSVPASSSFIIEALDVVDYCCSFID